MSIAMILMVDPRVAVLTRELGFRDSSRNEERPNRALGWQEG